MTPRNPTPHRIAAALLGPSSTPAALVSLAVGVPAVERACTHGAPASLERAP